MLKRIIPIAVIILVLVGGGYYYQKNANKPTPKPKNNTEITNSIPVTIKITNGTQQKTSTLKVKKDSTVLEMMKNAQAQNKIKYTSSTSSYGVMIDSINGAKNDTATKTYWSYYINGKMAPEGVSTQKLKSNDQVEWKYESF